MGELLGEKLKLDGFESVSADEGCKHDPLTASAKASPRAATAAGLPTLEAILAIHGTVAAGLEWNCCLLSAAGTDHARALGRAALVSASAAARLLVLLGLAACFTTLRRRITTLAEVLLILARKRE
jgi:hypothetical protein